MPQPHEGAGSNRTSMTSHIEFGKGSAAAALHADRGQGWRLVGEDTSAVEIAFVGHLDTEGGVSSAEVVSKCLRESRRKLVLDVRDMEGYDRGARIAWQEVLWPQRDRIRALVLVGGNAVVRMGASVMAMFLGVPLERHEAEVTPLPDRRRRSESTDELR